MRVTYHDLCPLHWALPPFNAVRGTSDHKEKCMPNHVKPIPEGYHSISPSLTCRNASQAIDFYKRAFGAKEIMRSTIDGGKISHAEVKIGDSIVFLNDELPGMAAPPP